MKDPALRAASSVARGVWIDCLCLMWESPRRGFLVHASGRAVTTEQLARMTGNSVETATEALTELESCGVCSRTSDGVIFSRRMERDERKRKKCSIAGKKGGGNPTFKGTPKGGSKGHVKGESKGTPKRFTEVESEDSMPEGRRGKFVPPTAEEVDAYCLARKNGIAGKEFVNHYEANGWMRGANKIKDWRACVRTWEEKRKQGAGPKLFSKQSASEHNQSAFDDVFGVETRNGGFFDGGESETEDSPGAFPGIEGPAG